MTFRTPSVKAIRRINGVGLQEARKVKSIMDAAYTDDRAILNPSNWPECYHLELFAQRVGRALELIDAAICTHGVEAINCEDKFISHYWQHCVAAYCNNGDPYTATVLFDTDRDVFYVTSWGDWLETAERTRRYKFQ